MSTASRSIRLASGARAFARSSGPVARRSVRHATTTTTSAATPQSGISHGVIGGLAGGSAVLAVGYGYYHYSGAGKVVSSMSETKKYVEDSINKIKSTQLKPDDTVQWLRDTANQYARFVPGAKGAVDMAFNEIDELKEKHGDELNELINNAHKELKDVASNGALDMATAFSVWTVVSKYLSKMEGMAKELGGDLLSKHPEIKEQYGDKLSTLKKMAASQGGEAKKLVDDAYKQVEDMVKSGKFDTKKLGQLVDDATKKAQSLGDDAWKSALDKAKPFIDKQPELKKLVEDNADKLKSGDFKGLVAQLTAAVKKGDAGDLQAYVEKQIKQFQGMSDDAWKGAMARASIYLDKYPEVKKILEDKGEVLRKIDWDEFMDRLRKAKDSGDIAPVKEYIEKQAKKLKDQ